MNPKIHSLKRGGAFALAICLLASVLCLLISPPSAAAGQYSLLAGDTNVFSGAVSNLYKSSGDTTVYTNGTALTANILNTVNSRDVWLSATGLFTNTAASVASYRVTLYPSNDGANYLATSNVVIWINVPATTTNYYTGLAIAPLAFPVYSVHAIDGTNALAGAVGTISVKAFTKPGI